MKKLLSSWRGVIVLSWFPSLVWLVISSASATDLLVYNINDSGPGSLRHAIELNAALGGGNRIVFSNTVTGVITLGSELVVSNSLTIAGPGATALTVSGNNATRVFRIASQPAVNISGLTIGNGRVASNPGGGIYQAIGSTLMLSDCAIVKNRAEWDGGGLFTGGTLLASNCLFFANESGVAVAGGTGGGGAISQQSSGQMTLINCAFVGNTNSRPSDDGGAIWSVTGNAAINNCTFAGNFSAGNGGALGVTGGPVTITNCTIAANRATQGGGIYRSTSSLSVMLQNTILAGNTGSLGGPDVYGAVTSLGHNLVGNTSGSSGWGATGDQLNVAALLGPLQDNGGPTPTLKPAPGSPAIDQGFTGGGTDQRGRARPFTNAIPPATSGDHSDIGAVEVQPDDLPSAIPPSLVSWWRAEDNFLDSAGTNHGAPDSLFLFGDGRVGRAFRQYFLGGGYVRVPASPTLNVGAGSGFSVEAWINVLDTATEYPIVEWNSGPNIGAHLWANVAYAGVGTPGCIYASVDNNLAHRVATPAVLQAQTWHHVVMTYDRYSSLSVYVDGILKAQTNFGAATPATAFDLNIGRRPGGPYFYGMLDEVSLYNRALSAADVAALYVRGGAGKELPKLRIVSTPAGSVSLYWQLAYASYGLESRSNLTTAPWLPVAQPRAQAGAEWKTVAPLLPGREFFRLRKP